MKNIFLTSSNNFVAKEVAKHVPNFRKGMKLVFIPTAAEVEKGDLSWLNNDRQALIDVGYVVQDFSVTNKTLSEVQEVMEKTDVIFFSGGNTYFLLQELQRSNCMKYIKDRVEHGLIYMGSSAGSIVAGPSIELVYGLDKKEFAQNLTSEKGLELTNVITFPHWGSPLFNKRYEVCMKNGYKTGNKIILLTDDQYLWVKDSWYQIMSI